MATQTDRDVDAFHAAGAAFWRGEPCPDVGAARNGWLAAAGEAQRQVVADRAFIQAKTKVRETLHQAGAALRACEAKKLTPRERSLLRDALVLIQAVLPYCEPAAPTRRAPSSSGGTRDLDGL